MKELGKGRKALARYCAVDVLMKTWEQDNFKAFQLKETNERDNGSLKDQKVKNLT